jgi:hypothetical protein
MLITTAPKKKMGAALRRRCPEQDLDIPRTETPLFRQFYLKERNMARYVGINPRVPAFIFTSPGNDRV